MHIVWDQLPRWRKEANDGGEKKSASEAGETTDWGGSSIPRSVSARPVIRDL